MCVWVWGGGAGVRPTSDASLFPPLPQQWLPGVAAMQSPAGESPVGACPPLTKPPYLTSNCCTDIYKRAAGPVGLVAYHHCVGAESGEREE